MDNLFIERKIYQKVKTWLFESEIIAISGPRQSGKTTLLKKLAQELVGEAVCFVNFEETASLENFLASPQTFVKVYFQGHKRTFFLFDEYQYVEGGGKILKLLYDSFPQAKFIITGSSSLKIKELASFLVGRVVFFNLYPLSFAEFLSFKDKTLFSLHQTINHYFLEFLKQNLNSVNPPTFILEQKFTQIFEEYLKFGGYPAVVTTEDEEKKKKRLESLVETYIEKDIIRYLQIGNYLQFKNLVKILSTQVGNILSYTSLSSDSQLSFRELKRFLGVLEQTLVIKLIPPFFKNLITELKKNPKVYFLDLGLRNSLIADFRNLQLRPDKGALVENLVFQNLFYEERQLSFWRTKMGAEVDFCLVQGNEVIPLEVKFQDFEKPKLSRSLGSFLKTYSPPKVIVLTKNYLSRVKKEKSNILFLPIYFL